MNLSGWWSGLLLGNFSRNQNGVKTMSTYLGETYFLHGSHIFLHVLGANTLIVFVLGYLFKDVCIVSCFGK